MQDATHPHTCRSACFGCMRRDISCLADPPRAPHGWLHVQDTCRTPPLLPDVRLHDWNSCKAPHILTHVDQHASVACAETPRAWPFNLVLLCVRLHGLLPCTATPRASVDTQLAGWLTPRSEPLQRATSSFSVHSPDFDHSDIPRKLRDEETSVFKNVELLNRLICKGFYPPLGGNYNSRRSGRCFRRTDLAYDTCLWEPKVLLRVGNRASGACVASSPDSDLEALSHNPAHGSFAPLAFQPSAMTNCANQRFLSSKGSIGHAFTVRIRTENQNQTSFYPFVPHEISVLVELVLGHLRYLFTDVPPQPNSPPGNVLLPDLPAEASLGSKRRGCYPAPDSQRK
ncbi:hypothetical protein YC2023_072267 [Brassica napus]